MSKAESVTEEQPSQGGPAGFRQDFSHFWAGIPHKGFFALFLLAWLALFHFLGSATLGYVDSPSLFAWLDWMWDASEDDAHGRYIPFVVLGLLWWKRETLLSVVKRPWWPAMGLITLGLLIHVAGYMIQQTQITVIGFFVGLYGLTGLIWGPAWLASTFFPFCLFAFCLPIGNVSGPISFHLRLLATKITAVVCQVGLGIDVIHNGTRILDPSGAYQYEVAAACSGIRSLTAVSALAMIYAFVMLKSWWRRSLMLLSAFPLAVLGNVVRLCIIVVASEAFGSDVGKYIHNSSWLSLLPYVPAILGILILGHFLREDRVRKRALEEKTFVEVEQGL